MTCRAREMNNTWKGGRMSGGSDKGSTRGRGSASDVRRGLYHLYTVQPPWLTLIHGMTPQTQDAEHRGSREEAIGNVWVAFLVADRL